MEPSKQGVGEFLGDGGRRAVRSESRPYDQTTGQEGKVTKQIESYTSRVPSGAFLAAGIAAIGVSAILQVSGARRASNFVGQWVPTVLILGLYNKVVKLHGSEA